MQNAGRQTPVSCYLFLCSSSLCMSCSCCSYCGFLLLFRISFLGHGVLVGKNPRSQLIASLPLASSWARVCVPAGSGSVPSHGQLSSCNRGLTSGLTLLLDVPGSWAWIVFQYFSPGGFQEGTCDLSDRQDPERQPRLEWASLTSAVKD